MLTVKPRTRECYRKLLISISYRKGKQEPYSSMSWSFSIYSFPSHLWHSENILSGCLLQRKTEILSLSSPIASKPYHLVYMLRNRALFQTNAHHLWAFSNTWSDHKPNRQVNKEWGNVFKVKQQEKTSHEQMPFIFYGTRQAIFFGWVSWQGKFHLSAKVLIPVLNYFLSSMIILEQTERWSKTIHCDKFNGWKTLGTKI